MTYLTKEANNVNRTPIPTQTQKKSTVKRKEITNISVNLNLTHFYLNLILICSKSIQIDQ